MKGFDDFDLCLGDVLRGERATMGKSLLDVQRELKIKAGYISAIENADPTAFDTPGFVAGYVRSYARYLGLDPEWVFKAFCEESGFEVAHGMAPQASSRRPESAASLGVASKGGKGFGRDPFTEPSVSYLPKGEAALAWIEPRAILSIAVLLALLSGIGYGGWAVLQEVQKVRLTPVNQTPEVLAELDPMANLGSAEEFDSSGVSAAGGDRFDRLSRPEVLDLPVMTFRDGPIASIDPNTIGSLAPARSEGFIGARVARPDNIPFATPGGESTSVASVDPGLNGLEETPVQIVADADPSVSLFAVRPSWVRVRAADGTVIFEKILDAGERFDVPLTEEPPTLRAGNANSLYFGVGDQTYGPAGDGPQVVKDIVLSAENVRDGYTVANPEGDSDLARFIAVAEAQSE